MADYLEAQWAFLLEKLMVETMVEMLEKKWGLLLAELMAAFEVESKVDLMGEKLVQC